MFISISVHKHPNLYFRHPNTHSRIIRADESLNLKKCYFSLDPPFTDSFIKKGSNGYAGSPKIHTGNGSSPSTIILEQLGIYSFLRLSFNPEKSLGSCALPGHFITKSKNNIDNQQQLPHNE